MASALAAAAVAIELLGEAIETVVPANTANSLLFAGWNIRALGSLTAGWNAAPKDSPKRGWRAVPLITETISHFAVGHHPGSEAQHSSPAVPA